MENVSQKEAAEVMPLAGAERARFWRDRRFRDMECLSAKFQFVPGVWYIAAGALAGLAAALWASKAKEVTA